MAQLVISAAGAAIGGFLGGPVGAQVGWTIGSLVGSQFGPKQKSQGPRLEDLRVTGAEYGQTIPWVAGHPRVAGQVWWASDRREISTTTSVGKGGGGAEVTSYTYEVDILFGLCNRQIEGIRRVWMNGKLVWTAHEDATTSSMQASNENAPWSNMTVYGGNADQLPDPIYEAAVGNAPAYRGRGTVFMEALQLGNSGVIPNFTFEVVVSGTRSGALTKLQTYFAGDDSADVSAYQHGEGTIVTVGSGSGVTISGEAFNFYAQGAPTPGGYLQWTGLSELAHYGGPITIEWFSTMRSNKNVSYTTSLIYVSNDALSGSYTFSFGYYGSPTVIHVYNGSNLVNVTANQRTHHAFVLGTTSTRYYIDGALVYSNAGPPPGATSAAGSLKLGANGYNNSEIDDYGIDSFRVRFEEVYTAPFTPPAELPAPDGGAIVPDEGVLQAIVEELCELAGMPAGSYDVSGLASITKPVRGFVVSQVASVRSALEQLASAYFFECYTTDKLYFVPRAGSVADAIDEDDMGAGVESPEAETMSMQIKSEMEIPAQTALSYANVDADYTTATEHSDRLVS